MKCHRCGKEVEQQSVGRRDVCPGCGLDLRCCLNCNFYNASYANSCKEPQAERVLDKDKSTFCDYFIPGKQTPQTEQQLGTEAKNKLDALFKK